jgi:hypothetical protein
MTSKLKSFLKRVEAWPEIDQKELTEYATRIEERRSRAFVRNEREWADLQQRIGAADRDEYVSDEGFTEAD